MLLTPILFAASITLGEILVAERRFLFYALAPILYNVGIVAGTVLLHERIGIHAAAVGAVIGALLHLGIRVVGMARSKVRIRPRLRLRMPAVREFLLLMVPKMLAHPIEPITFLFFTNVASGLAAGSVTSVSFARNFQSVPVALVGVADLAGRVPVAVGGLGVRRPGGVRPPRADERDHDHGADGHLGGRCSSSSGRSRSRSSSAVASSTPRTSASRGWCSRRSRSPSRSTPSATSPRAACTRPTTRCSRCSRRSPGSRSRSGPRSPSSTASACIAIPLGFAAGTAVRTVLQGTALAWRIGRAPIPEYVPEGDEAADAAEDADAA